MVFTIIHAVFTRHRIQYYAISPQHYDEIFYSSSTIFSNVKAVECVYSCLVSGDDIGLRLAVYHKEPRICSCVTRMVTSTDAENAVGVEVVQVKKG